MNETITADANTSEETVHAGRPRVPLLVGQCRFIERAYIRRGLSQAHIAQVVGVAIPRVRRYLVEQGLYQPRPSQRPAKRAEQLDNAIQAYVDGDKVVEICQTYEVNPAELYRELRRRGLPFRTKVRVYRRPREQQHPHTVPQAPKED